MKSSSHVVHSLAGAHILSGNVLEPRALDELLPNWRNEEVSAATSQNASELNQFIRSCLPWPEHVVNFWQEPFAIDARKGHFVTLRVSFSCTLRQQYAPSSVQSPIRVPATKDQFYLLTEKRAIRMPSPFQNHGKFVTRQGPLSSCVLALEFLTFLRC